MRPRLLATARPQRWVHFVFSKRPTGAVYVPVASLRFPKTGDVSSAATTCGAEARQSRVGFTSFPQILGRGGFTSFSQNPRAPGFSPFHRSLGPRSPSFAGRHAGLGLGNPGLASLRSHKSSAAVASLRSRKILAPLASVVSIDPWDRGAPAPLRRQAGLGFGNPGLASLCFHKTTAPVPLPTAQRPSHHRIIPLRSPVCIINVRCERQLIVDVTSFRNRTAGTGLLQSSRHSPSAVRPDRDLDFVRRERRYPVRPRWGR